MIQPITTHTQQGTLVQACNASNAECLPFLLPHDVPTVRPFLSVQSLMQPLSHFIKGQAHVQEQLSALRKQQKEGTADVKRKQGQAVKLHLERSARRLAEQSKAAATAQKLLADALDDYKKSSKVGCTWLV